MKLRSIFKEIISITKDAEFKNDNQLSVKICQLLDMLVHMQSINIFIRAELIEKLFSIRPDLSHKIINQKKKEPIIILYDRRKVNPDRRKLHIHLANNRRIGIADRRKSTKNIRAEIRPH
jgi:hypothetical protein